MTTGHEILRRPGLRLVAYGDRVVLHGAPERRDVMARVAEAHGAVDSPHVPKLANVALDGPEPLVAFDSRARVGGAAVIRELTASGRKCGYPASIAFNEIMMDAVEAMHAAGCHLGALSWDHLLIGADGTLEIIGAGHNYPARPGGDAVAAPGLVEAPETTFGGAPTAASDVYCLHALLRGLLPFVEVPDYLAKLPGGETSSAAYQAVMRLALGAMAPDPAARPQSVAELRALSRAVRAEVPEMPSADFASLAEVLAELCEAARPTRDAPTLHVDLDARAARLPDGAEVELGRRATLWRILAHLARARRDAPGRAVTMEDLVEAGWPDEKILPDAARARVYVALSSLRKLGLADLILSRDGGYLLDPDVAVAFA